MLPTSTYPPIQDPLRGPSTELYRAQILFQLDSNSETVPPDDESERYEETKRAFQELLPNVEVMKIRHPGGRRGSPATRTLHQIAERLSYEPEGLAKPLIDLNQRYITAYQVHCRINDYPYDVDGSTVQLYRTEDPILWTADAAVLHIAHIIGMAKYSSMPADRNGFLELYHPPGCHCQQPAFYYSRTDADEAGFLLAATLLNATDYLNLYRRKAILRPDEIDSRINWARAQWRIDSDIID